MISVPEFQAVGDLIDDTIAECESLSLDDGVDVHNAFEIVRRKARDAQLALEMAMQTQLEGQVVIRDGRQFEMTPFDGYSYDHNEIAKRVARIASMPDGEGVVPTAHRAAAEAARMMLGLYVSDSTDAKVGDRGKPGLETFGIPKNEVREARKLNGRKRVKISTVTTPDTPRRDQQ